MGDGTDSCTHNGLLECLTSLVLDLTYPFSAENCRLWLASGSGAFQGFIG